MKKWAGYIMLLMTAFIWGTAFVAQSVGMDHDGPFTFNFSRYFIGALALAPFAVIGLSRKKWKIVSEDKDEKEKSTEYSKYLKYTIFGGIGCGILLCVASSLQQFGILYTDAVGKSGFLTALYIIIVPIIGMFFGKKTKFFTLTQHYKDFIEREFPGRFAITGERDLFEYFYTYENQAEYPGKKLKQRRLEYRHFWNEYGDRAAIYPLERKDHAEVMEFLRFWILCNS